MGKLEEVKSQDDFRKALTKRDDTVLQVFHFKSAWSPACNQMTELLDEMKANEEEYPGVEFAEIMAESFPEISVEYKISAVPTVLLFVKGKEVERVDGLRTGRLTNLVRSYVLNPRVAVDPVERATEPAAKQEPLEERLKKLVNKHQIMVFMKGNPAAPRCGFSNTLMGILKETGLPFETFDILSDDEVRQGLKTFSNWQTYPQVYVKGELIGGLDIIKEMKDSDELIPTLKSEV